MKLSEIKSSELYKEYKELSKKISEVRIISQSNPGPIMELRYYKKRQEQIYEELEKRNNKLIADNRNKDVNS